jgi:Predicted Zn-dependent peptidases
MYRIGFRIEPKGRTGFAHLFEHLMFQGPSTSQVRARPDRQRERRHLNGSTRFDHTNYFEVMPSNALELAMWLEADRMRSLKITPETLKNQQDVVSEEVASTCSISRTARSSGWACRRRRTRTGTTRTTSTATWPELEAANLDDVKKFYDTYYAPNNAVLVVSGDTTPTK